MVRCGPVWSDTILCSAVLCGAVRGGVLWCVAVWYGGMMACFGRRKGLARQTIGARCAGNVDVIGG